MKKIIPFLFLYCNASVSSLLPFKTDGCTYFLDGTKKSPTLWQHCCYIHDIKYWIGGGRSDQSRADISLKKCVEEVAGIEWATLIYRGVILGHYSPIKNEHAWAWGYKNKENRYEKLNEEELLYARDSILNLNFPIEILNQTIEEYFIIN